MKYELLKALYDCFYTPPELTPPKQEAEECHQALIEVLGKTERRLVLQIIDAKDRIAEDMHETGFPALRIGNRIVVPKEKFRQWVDAQAGGDA